MINGKLPNFSKELGNFPIEIRQLHAEDVIGLPSNPLAKRFLYLSFDV